MVCAKRPAILPLRITDAVSFTNGNPAMAADRLARPGVGLLKPRDHQRGFGLKLAVRDIVIRQCEVERILPRDKRDWNVIPARARLRSIRATIVRCPIQIPRTLVVRHRIVSAGLFPHPKDRGDNIHLPRVTLDSWAGTR